METSPLAPTHNGGLQAPSSSCGNSANPLTALRTHTAPSTITRALSDGSPEPTQPPDLHGCLMESRATGKSSFPTPPFCASRAAHSGRAPANLPRSAAWNPPVIGSASARCEGQAYAVSPAPPLRFPSGVWRGGAHWASATRRVRAAAFGRGQLGDAAAGGQGPGADRSGPPESRAWPSWLTFLREGGQHLVRAFRERGRSAWGVCNLCRG